MHLRLWLLGFFLGCACPGVAADPVITEFMASNSSGLQDEDGDFSDWLEIHNPGPGSLDLDGWFLTDNASNRTKWRFPATVIPAGGYKVVFASNKNRAVSGQPLHTNFALSAGGEFLGLIAPDGVTAVSAYAPQFPEQSANVSYGIPSNVVTNTFVVSTAAGKWIVPTSASNPASSWRDWGFNDSSWNTAVMGLGYERGTSGVNFLPEIGSGGNTESAMYNVNQTCYLRLSFPVSNPADVLSLKLRLKYDDGFAAYLNGQPLRVNGTALTRNAPATLSWNSGATRTHEDTDAMIFEEFDVSSSINQLAAGNVLAFHLLNRNLGSSDFLFKPELTAEVVDPSAVLAPGFFSSATPGARNGGPSTLVIPQQVGFSRAEGTFTSNFNLTLSGEIGGQVIRYTTNGSLPTASSTLYSGPISITTSTLVRARVFDGTTGASGAVTGANYEKLGTTLASYGSTGVPFRSSLPVMVLNNRGIGELPNDDVYRDVRLHVFDRDASGYSDISAAPALNSMAGAKIRGSSSAGFDKKSYSIELRAESLDSRNLEILGLPAGSDWALISCYNYDPSFMRNAWVYEAFRRTGKWSPRTRFVELFFNQNGNELDYADYRGVYVLCETVRDDADRVDITSIETADVTQPALSGGYIFKVDRFDSDEFHWQTTRGLPVNTTGNELTIHRPKLANLSPAQSSYLVGYYQQFEDAIYTDAAGGFASRNYRNYIDSASWVEHNLFNAFAKNVDALRLSAYFIKDRGRRMEGGPLWDFDRSADSTDGRDNEYYTWMGTGDATNYFTYAWWQPLFSDVEFRQLFVDRWQDLRSGVLATADVNSIFDGFLAEFKTTDADHPARRDYARWYGSATAKNLDSEVSKIKSWLSNRAAWIDSQFTSRPTVVTPPGLLVSGQSVTLGVPSGTTVYYRLDGLDPRAEGGGVRSGSLVYASPIPLASTTLLTARAWRSGSFTTPATNWSGMVKPLYLIGESYATAADLRVSAVHYHPLAPDAAETAALADVSESDFEWIEFMNNGAAPVNLEGVTLEAGKPVSPIVLPAFTLAPGERGVVVKRLAAFLLRHPAAASRVVAEWTGDKSLDNNGETIIVRDRSGGLIVAFAYDDGNGWPSRADGDGGALEFLGPDNLSASYQNAANWRTSAEIHGSPGAAGSGPRERVFINEVLASSAWPELDAIELHNPGPATVDVGGWYLSNTPAAVTVDDYRMFRIPDGTVLQPGGFRVFTEADFNPNGPWNPTPGAAAESEFALDGFRGGRVWLISADAVSGRPDAFEDHFEFSPAPAGISLGRWPDASDHTVPLAADTLFDASSSASPSPGLGAANTAPRLGDVQVSEILYHPASGKPEYLEIVNVSAETQPLAQWTLRGDVDLDFPDTSLAPGEVVLLVDFDPAAEEAAAASFRALYQVPSGTRLLGSWSAGDSLGDASGTVRLRRRVPAPPEDPSFVGLMVEDEVIYSSQAPWPDGASGTGLAIRRLGPLRQGSDPTSWMAAETSAGSDAGGWQGWLAESFPGGGPLTGPLDDFDHDGIANRIEYRMGTDPRAVEGSPWSAALAAPEQGGDFYLEYRVRRDRDEFPLVPAHSADLLEWSEVADDRHHADDGLFEIRRAHIPASAASGFLRLECPPAE